MTYTIREASNDDAPKIRGVVSVVLKEYGLDSDPEGIDRDLDDIERNYQANGGTFRVVESEHTGIVGCGGLLRVSADEVELRKMYLLPAARGGGIGKKMLEEFIEFARQIGASKITLETASVLREAISLYKKYGFVSISRDQFPARCDQAWELRLC